MPLLIRRLHGYIGMLTAPTLLFFALTGVLQIYRLHEAHGAYRPPAVISILGQFHKNQEIRPPRTGSRPEHKGDGQHAPLPPLKLKTTLLRAFFALAAASLAVSTVLGVWMGLLDRRRRLLHLILLVAGTALPLLLAVS